MEAFDKYWEKYEKEYDAEWWEYDRHEETWDAAIKYMEEKFKSTNKASPKCGLA